MTTLHGNVLTSDEAGELAAIQLHFDRLDHSLYEKDADDRRLGMLLQFHHRLAARVAELEETNAGLRYEMTTTDHNVCQCLGLALNYPRFADDQANFPGATDADGVCVGEHVAETLAIEAAREIDRLRAELALHQNAQPDFDVLVAKYGEPEIQTDRYHEADYKWPNGLTWHVQREGESYARVNGSAALWTYDAIKNALAAMKDAAK